MLIAGSRVRQAGIGREYRGRYPSRMREAMMRIEQMVIIKFRGRLTYDMNYELCDDVALVVLMS